MEKLFAKAKVPVIPLRAEPSEKAEQVSQVLFGEYVEIISEIEGWTEVAMVTDGYIGWLDSKMIEMNKSLTKLFPQSFAKVASSFILARAINSGETIHLTAGSVLNNYAPETTTFKASNVEYKIVLGNVLNAETYLSMEETLALSKDFLNAPYLWGGRSIFGVDCSGFVQMLYSLLGVQLPRGLIRDGKKRKANFVRTTCLAWRSCLFWCGRRSNNACRYCAKPKRYNSCKWKGSYR